MPFYKIIKFLLFFLLGGKLLFAQNYPSKNYTAANELPNNAVRSVFVDSKNILWIGTENGVVRKENDAFTNFFEEDGLALNSCWAIAEDNNKNLWFGSYGGGVSIYNGRNFEVISEEDGLAHNEVNRMFSYENYMFIGTSDGVSRIDINTFEVVSWNVPHGKSLFRVTGFFEYNNDIYVATYTTGIYKISREGEYSNLVKVNDQKYIYSVFKGSDSIYSSNKNFYTKSSLKEYLQRDTSIHKRLGYSIFWDHIKTRSDKIFTAAWGIYDANGGIYEINNETLIPRAGDFNISSKKLVSLAYDKKFDNLTNCM